MRPTKPHSCNSAKYRRIAAVTLLAAWLVWSNITIDVSTHIIRSGRIPAAFSGFRIVQVSDLHNARFGKGNTYLLQLIRDARPDIIVITGDLVDSRNTDIGIALEFVRDALEIAPVYYVTGNHESRISEYEQLRGGLMQAGAVLLENEKVALEREGERITLLGVHDPTFRAGTPGVYALESMTEVSDGYTILLSHRPELFEVYTSCGVDLAFCGHAHGGQVRIPFVGGLVAPHQGFFPAYDAGLYTAGSTNMLVSRGVGNSVVPVRINNRPELIVAQLESISE